MQLARRCIADRVGSMASTTFATLGELAEPFGLSHPYSVRSLLNRAEEAMRESAKFRKEVVQLRCAIQKT